MVKGRHLRHPLRAFRAAGFLLRLHGEAVLRCLEGWLRYRVDPRFQLEAVRKGFQDRRTSGADAETLHRICRAYRSAIALPQQNGYEATGWWSALRQSSLRRVLIALETGDVRALGQMYENFFRDSCSDGLVGKPLLLVSRLSMGLRRIHQGAHLTESLCRIERWRSLTSESYDFADLRGPEIGNPFGIMLEGSLIAHGAEHSHYGARRIIELTQHPDAVVIEIGGGYGRMAYYLLRDSPRLRYWNFDLPESLALAAYYLIQSFPERRTLLHGESVATDPGDDQNVVLLPISQLSSMPVDCADIVFSAHSMSDLSEDATRIYLQQVQRLTRNYFLYQGMTAAAARLEKMIAHEYRAFALVERKEYVLHGPDRRSHLQCELLYEKLPHDQTWSHAERSRLTNDSSSKMLSR